LEVCKRSDSLGASAAAPDAVIVLDTIGELSQVYALASVCFVGGSLADIGGHNIIEPASFGKPVIFGPHMHHFEDVKHAFLSEDAAITVNDAQELFDILSQILKTPVLAGTLGEAAKRVVATHRGATERYFEAIMRYI
jgi:3-deoxy-D-manno-octulosonic-acid transferase